jgi:hypothetical protein
LLFAIQKSSKFGRFLHALLAVMFQRPSRLTPIEQNALGGGQSLNHILIPAPPTAIAYSAFGGKGIRWIEIEGGLVSLRVVNAFFVDFEVRSLVWVIGSPE